MKLKQIFPRAVLIILSFLSTSTLAGQWYGGLYGSFIDAYANLNYSYRCDGGTCTDALEIYRGNVTQTGYGGGLTFGVWIPFASQYAYGFAIDGFGSSGSGIVAFSNDAIPPSNSDIRTRFSMRYNVSVVAAVLMHITQQFSAYFKVGPSIVGARIKLRIKFSGNGAARDDMTKTNHQVYIGWLAGVGFTQSLSKQWNVFMEYNYLNYGSHEIGTFSTADLNQTNAGFLGRNFRSIFANVVKVGVNYNF